jgi:hypothetical protein
MLVNDRQMLSYMSHDKLEQLVQVIRAEESKVSGAGV